MRCYLVRSIAFTAALSASSPSIARAETLAQCQTWKKDVPAASVDACHAIYQAELAGRPRRAMYNADPNPLPARRVYELVAEHARTRPPRGFIPGRLARTLLRTPGIEKLARGPLAFLDSFDHQVFYNQRTTQELLEGTGLRCPSFEKYVANLVKYVQDVHAARRVSSIEDEVFDPFD